MFQKDIWDKVWENGDFSDWDEGAQSVLDVLKKEVGNLDGKKMLEAGSGTGRISLRLALEGAKVTLVDFSETAIQQSKERFEKYEIEAEFYASDIMNLEEIRDNEYDVVWNAGVMEHFDLGQQVIVFEELKRILKPGGLLITLNPNANCITYQLGKWFMEKTNQWSFGQELPIYTLKETCERVGLEFIKEYSVGFNQSLFFLGHVPGTQMTKLAFEKWYESLPQEKKGEVEGYLLTTVCKKEGSSDFVFEVEHVDYVKMRELPEVKTIIMFSSVHFREDLWQRPQQLAVKFKERGYRVVYVNHNSITVKTSKPLSQLQTISFADRFLTAKQDGGIILLDRVDYLENAQGNKTWVQEGYFKQLLRFFNGGNSKVIAYYPQIAASLAKAKEQIDIKIFYDCVDEMSGFSNSKKIIMDEKKLIEISEGITVTAKTLFVHRSKENNNCKLITNGVNYEQFDKEFEKPYELRNFKGPIIGYVGAVAYWFDQHLVCELARKHPNWNFILVGSIYTNVEVMKKHKNIHLLGRVEYDRVPAFMKHFDVGIIPFKMVDLIVNTNPIKYFEYLAAGIETVATPMPELIDMPYCHLVENVDDFPESISQVLSASRRVEGIDEFLKENSWDKKAEEMIEFIENLESYKSRREDRLREIINGYEKFKTTPLIKVLLAEIYNELGDKTKAKSLLKDKKEVFHSSKFSQLSLALEWEDADYILFILKHLENNLGKNDIDYWSNKGYEFVKMHVLRKLGRFEEALNIASQLMTINEIVTEEVGNIYFEIGDIQNAVKFYSSIFDTKHRMTTTEAAVYFSKIAESMGKPTLSKHILAPHIKSLRN